MPWLLRKSMGKEGTFGSEVFLGRRARQGFAYYLLFLTMRMFSFYSVRFSVFDIKVAIFEFLPSKEY